MNNEDTTDNPTATVWRRRYEVAQSELDALKAVMNLMAMGMDGPPIECDCDECDGGEIEV